MFSAPSDDEKALTSLFKNNTTPTYRQAYSDRTAWLMACLSEIVYTPFNKNPETTKKILNEKLEDLLTEKTRDKLDKLVTEINKGEASDTISNFFNDANISIEHTYDHEDTQAFLVSTKKFLVLAFRGTEPTSSVDIKTDLSAALTPCKPNDKDGKHGRLHAGFKEAFEAVEAKIQKDLDRPKYANIPLLITGHSMGGALATIAAKELNHKGKIVACYTFGSPRVCDEKWSYNLKTSIFRVVNSTDGVTMLPPSGVTVDILKFILDFVFCFLPNTPIQDWIQRGIKKFEGYFHVGDMRYLTDCKKNLYETVELTYAVTFWRQVKIIWRSKIWTRVARDHSISIYRKKMAIIASRRNKELISKH